MDDPSEATDSSDAALETMQPERRHGLGVTFSVAVLMAIVLVCLGAGGAFLYTRAQQPATFQGTTSYDSVAVESGEFSDTHNVSVTVAQIRSQSVMSPISGTVTHADCSAGAQIASGTSCISVDDRALPFVYLSVPAYRDMPVGVKGNDAKALNDELRHLGYAAPDSNTVTSATIAAYNALATAIGAPNATDNTIARSDFIWLPQQTVTVADSKMTYGGTICEGDEMFSTSILPTSVTFSRTLSSGTLAAGDRTVSINGEQYTIPDGMTEVDDPDVVSAVLASPEYAQALSSANGAADGADAGGSGTIQISYSWSLATPLSVVSVPPSALYDVDGTQGCVVDAGTPHAVSIVASQLGRTMVTADDAFDHVDVPAPARAATCR